MAAFLLPFLRLAPSAKGINEQIFEFNGLPFIKNYKSLKLEGIESRLYNLPGDSVSTHNNTYKSITDPAPGCHLQTTGHSTAHPTPKTPFKRRTVTN